MSTKPPLTSADLDRIYNDLIREGGRFLSPKEAEPVCPLCTIDRETGELVPIDPESDLGKKLMEGVGS